MAIDATFQPQGPTVLVGTTAVQVPGAAGGSTSYRIRNISASVQYFSWGTASVGAPVAPVAGTPSANTIGMLGGSVETFCISSNPFLIAGTATGFEVTPGEGV